MLFNSLHYLMFLPVVVAVYFALSQQARRYWLLAASFYFYSVFSIPMSLLMAYSTLQDYVAARIIDSARQEWKRKTALILSLSGNLALLFLFKYFDFFAVSVNSATGAEWVPVLNLILPIGISFYTFQTMAYTIDVYRREIPAEKNILDVALYVTYFPQLVAGPIMRAGDLMPQFREQHDINTARILSGFLLVVWGLSKKMFIAEPMGHMVNEVYANPAVYSGEALLLATYAFAIQIFADFSAYTDIAIGSARIMGFRLMENFRTPYLAVSLRDFWHRWHISLSTWLRDYLYIPLGGSRKGALRTYLNLMAVMLLGGLWHGASWNFVIWGGLHGAFLAFERASGLDKKKPENMSAAGKLIGWFFTFHLVCLAWIFFRTENMDQAFHVLSGIVTWQGGAEISYAPLAVLAAVFGVGILQNRIDLRALFLRHAALARWIAYIGLALCIVAIAGGRSPEFIYFQF